MEAPEKIYLQVCGDCNDDDCQNCKFRDLEDNATWCMDKIFDKDIEYVKADVFIDKAATWFANRYQANGSYLNADDIEDFTKYMKGE